MSYDVCQQSNCSTRRTQGPVTLFRAFPTNDPAAIGGYSIGGETADQRRATNLLNRRLGERLRDDAHAGRGVLLSWTADHCSGRSTANHLVCAQGLCVVAVLHNRFDA